MKLHLLAAVSLVLLGASSVAAEEVSLDFVFVHMICSFYDDVYVLGSTSSTSVYPKVTPTVFYCVPPSSSEAKYL